MEGYESARVFSNYDNETIFEIIRDQIPHDAFILSENNTFISNYLSYCSIESDLELVKGATFKLIDFRIAEKECQLEKKHLYVDENLIIKKSLYTSIIINYGRCFNKSKKRVSLNEQFFKKNFPHDLLHLERTLIFHNKLLELRNKFIAHADENPYERVIGFMQFNFVENFLDVKVNNIISTCYSFDEDELENLAILTSFILKQIQDKKKKLAELIVKNIPEQELTKLAIETIINANKK